MENKTVFCPVLQRQVNGDDCFDISMVAEKDNPRQVPSEGLEAGRLHRRQEGNLFEMQISP